MYYFFLSTHSMSLIHSLHCSTVSTHECRVQSTQTHVSDLNFLSSTLKTRKISNFIWS